jgi:hypothetical protein
MKATCSDITLNNTGLNAIAAFAGSEDARPWVEMLNREVGVPPNLRECQWRLQPPRHFVEARKLAKLLKTSEWDEGKKLALPSIPRPGESLEELAGETVKQHNLNPAKIEAVRDVLIALRMKKEEQDGNQMEQDRQKGTEIRFGSAVILVHESTGLIHMHVHVCMHTCMLVCVCVCMYVCMYVCLYAFTYVCMYVFFLHPYSTLGVGTLQGLY